MIHTFNNINIYYERYGNSKGKTIVYLHGWGQNIEMMQPIAKPFEEEFDIIVIDLPGHGRSSEPTEVLEIPDFVECIRSLVEKLKITKPILVGHSFGGKVSLLYASKYEVEKLILFGSPFKKEIQKESLKLKTLKTLKRVPGLNKFEEFAKKHIGSTDYRNASPIMRQILVSHVNYDITEEIKKIKSPTLIVWGTNDAEVDISRAYELESLLQDAGLVVYEGCTHYAYLENLNQTIRVMGSFLRS